MTNEISAKVLGEILARGMSLSEVDLAKHVDSEAVRALGEIKNAMAEDNQGEEKLEKVQKILNQYNVG